MKKPRRGRREMGMPRARTISAKTLTLGVLRANHVETPDIDRPRTRGECRDGQRPCPWISCRHHLYLEINPHTGSIKLNYPHLEPWELAETCSLDIADRGGLTLEEVGNLTNLTRERIRQIEVRGLLSLAWSPPMKEIAR